MVIDILEGFVSCLLFFIVYCCGYYIGHKNGHRKGFIDGKYSHIPDGNSVYPSATLGKISPITLYMTDRQEFDKLYDCDITVGDNTLWGMEIAKVPLDEPYGYKIKKEIVEQLSCIEDIYGNKLIPDTDYHFAPETQTATFNEKYKGQDVVFYYTYVGKNVVEIKNIRPKNIKRGND